MSQNRTVMSTLRRDSAQSIEQAALVWVARVDRGELTSTEEAELSAWMAQDPRRAGAFARAMAANSYLDRTAALGQSYQPPKQSIASRIGRRELLGALAVGAIAASAAGVIGIPLLRPWDRITTSKGDLRRTALAEGSVITLNTDTEIEPDLSQTLRRVKLLKGEALFDVAKDRTRPFIVQAGDASVRVVGTRFTVRLYEDGKVAVAVFEGIVEVARDGFAPTRLTIGDTTVTQPGQPFTVRSLQQTELERLLSWRDGRLDLTGLTLGDAAAEFARYSNFPIIVDDASIAALKVAGVYSTSDPLGFARAAAASLDLVAAQQPEGIRILRAGSVGKNFEKK